MHPPLFRMPRLRRRSLSSRGTSANKRYASTMGYGPTSLQALRMVGLVSRLLSAVSSGSPRPPGACHLLPFPIDLQAAYVVASDPNLPLVVGPHGANESDAVLDLASDQEASAI